MLTLALLAAAPLLEYRVTASDGARVLDIEVHGDAGTLTLDGPLLPFVTVTDAGVPFRYRFRLEEAAQKLDSRQWAFADGKGLYAAPSSWLMHPPEVPADARFTLKVATPKGLSFVSGLRRTGEQYEAPLWVLGDAPWSGFAAFDTKVEAIGGATIEVAVAPGTLGLSRAQVQAWVVRSVSLVAAYYGSFPVPRVAVMVIPGGGGGVGFGTAMGNGGAAVLVWLGAGADEEVVMRHDWVLPHELFHFGLPNLPREHTWLEEGAATYLEPLIRARQGELTADDFWREMIEKLPQGLPEKGDRGLDRTPTWGRTYWGGALFLFVADVELRERTRNAQSLDTALKGIVAAGGTQEVQWDLARTLKAGDLATGLDVLTALHGKLGRAPGNVDLPKTFKRLGVSLSGGRVVYDDKAPLAEVRKAMTAKLPISSGRP